MLTETTGTPDQSPSGRLRLTTSRQRPLRVAYNMLSRPLNADNALPAFLIQIAAAVEQNGSATVRLRGLDGAADLPMRTGALLGSFAVGAISDVLSRSFEGTRPAIDVSVLRADGEVELRVGERCKRAHLSASAAN